MSDKVVPGLTMNELVDFLDTLPIQPTPVRPDGFGITITEYVDAKREQGNPVSADVARKYLNRLVKEGVLKKEQMVDGAGTSPLVYYRPDEEV